MDIKYAKSGNVTLTSEAFSYHPLWWHEKGLQETASGYGSKLTTPYKVRHNNRWKRVYAICWSNAASHYIFNKGQREYIHG
jgi:hypothetical protein